MDQGITFIVFAKDVGQDLMRTLDAAAKAALNLYIDYEIIVVDDGSKDTIHIEDHNIRKFNIVQLLRNDRSIGISGSILKGIAFCNFEDVLPVPGHNMYSICAIENVIRLMGQGSLVIGCRNNLALERPIIKKFASRILRDTYRHLTFYFVGDIHGLILYKRKDLERHLSLDGRHTNAIKVVTSVLVEGGLLIQTMAPINSGHDKRSSRRIKHSFPSPVNVFSVVKALRWARKKYKSKA